MNKPLQKFKKSAYVTVIEHASTSEVGLDNSTSEVGLDSLNSVVEDNVLEDCANEQFPVCSFVATKSIIKKKWKCHILHLHCLKKDRRKHFSIFWDRQAKFKERTKTNLSWENTINKCWQCLLWLTKRRYLLQGTKIFLIWHWEDTKHMSWTSFLQRSSVLKCFLWTITVNWLMTTRPGKKKLMDHDSTTTRSLILVALRAIQENCND